MAKTAKKHEVRPLTGVHWNTIHLSTAFQPYTHFSKHRQATVTITAKWIKRTCLYTVKDHNKHPT